ncbi:DUF6338 family protein [Roseateles chitosanitabidus]|uniref:DUF6338 family protein n=1 Tax=Roseateles chitosanitabidus TaxID=65048 RepID=UPI00082CA53A|nr:DUF6338 family protein [Roseateles chitosanitabidus]
MIEILLKSGLENCIFLLPGLISVAFFNVILCKGQDLDGLRVVLAVTVSFVVWFGLRDLQSNFGAWILVMRILVGALLGTVAGWVFRLKRDWRRRVRGVPGKRVSSALAWFDAFRGEQSHVLLHMKDGRKIFGWPEGWPQDPAVGHFLLIHPLVQANGRFHKLRPDGAAVLLPAADVSWVQFLDALQAESHVQKASVSGR